MPDNPYVQMQQQMLAAMNSALQTIVKTNMEAFESYQQQFRKVCEANAQVMSQVAPQTFRDVIKQQADDLERQIKESLGKI